MNSSLTIRSLVSIAKELYLTPYMLEKKIKNHDYPINNNAIIIHKKHNRTYKYISTKNYNLIKETHVQEALVLKVKFEMQGWEFDYDEIDQIENGYWLNETTPHPELNPKGVIPRKTYTPYIYPASSSEPLAIINECLFHTREDMWLYVAHIIKKNKIPVDVKVNKYGYITQS